MRNRLSTCCRVRTALFKVLEAMTFLTESHFLK